MESHQCRIIRHHGFRDRLRNCPRHSPWRKTEDSHLNPGGIEPTSNRSLHLGSFVFQLRKLRTERAARRWRSPSAARVTSAGARAAGGARNKREGMLPSDRMDRRSRFKRVPVRLSGFVSVVPVAGIAPTRPRSKRGRLSVTSHREKWRARPELHGHCSGLGPRPTVCCRRAHGWRGRSRTDNSR